MDTVETIKNLFINSGAGWVLWLLFGLSVGSVIVAVERFFVFRSKSQDLDGVVGVVDAHLKAGDREGGMKALAGIRSVGARVASAGMRLAGRGPRAAEKAMDSAMALERKGLEARLAYLGTLGNNAPFIGLLGTVIGVILAFEELGQANQAAGTGASQAASNAVMSAIAEALVATAVGIAVALPAVALYNYFQRRIANIMHDAEALSSLVVAYLVDTDEDQD
ncbi:MAG: MotA/TolQ/ExbB proton channel family protein [Myxococcota bacterium]